LVKADLGQIRPWSKQTLVEADLGQSGPWSKRTLVKADLGQIRIEVDKMSIKLTHIIAVFQVTKGGIKGNVSSSKMSKVADMG
jgi:hypothetical protein